jgi:predicted TIM-barrel fold metal-dependent hydrolase
MAAVTTSGATASGERKAHPRGLPPRLVDAHMHLWDLSLGRHPWLCDEPPIPFRYGDYRAIRKSYMPEDYRRDAAGLGIGATVYIEAEWDPADPAGETAWVSALAEREGFPHAVVAQAWLDRADVADVLAAQAGFPLVRGVRHKPKAAASPAEAARGQRGSMDDPRWRDGYALLRRHGLHFELQTPFWHLDAALDLARDVPETLIVLNHTGLPADRSAEGMAAWRRALERFADAPNARLKISGLGLAGQRWSAEGNRPVVRDAIAIFGAGRCMFASNFPVDSLVGRMADIFAGFAEATGDFDPAARMALFHDNAAALYRIATPPAEVAQPEQARGGTA